MAKSRSVAAASGDLGRDAVFSPEGDAAVSSNIQLPKDAKKVKQTAKNTRELLTPPFLCM
jgi:hypothetical protein